MPLHTIHTTRKAHMESAAAMRWTALSAQPLLLSSQPQWRPPLHPTHHPPAIEALHPSFNHQCNALYPLSCRALCQTCTNCATIHHLAIIPEQMMPTRWCLLKPHKTACASTCGQVRAPVSFSMTATSRFLLPASTTSISARTASATVSPPLVSL